MPVRTKTIRRHCQFVIIGAIAAAYTFSLLVIDLPLAELVRRDASVDFIKLVQIFIMVTIQASPFTMLMLVHKYALSMCRNHVLRNRILIIILSFILAIVSVEILKIVFGRTGPNDYLATGIHEFRYFQGSMTLSSFPSVYCAGAGAIAATYWIILPPYRLTIILLSLLGLGSQVATEAVFLSDGLAGFVVGTISFLGLKKLFHTRRAVLVETE